MSGGSDAESEIGRRIRVKLESGKLPMEKPSRVWSGSGTDHSCDACDDPITPADIEYEVNVSIHDTLRFHQHCFNIWHEERLLRIARRGAVQCVHCRLGIGVVADLTIFDGRPFHSACLDEFRKR